MNLLAVAAAHAAVTLSWFQVAACCAIALAFAVIGYALGLNEGRLRGACEPGHQPIEDENEWLEGDHR